MGLGVSLVLIAVGAILTFAVNAHVAGVNINTVGWILMAVGFIGALISLIFLGSRRTMRVRDYQDPPDWY